MKKYLVLFALILIQGCSSSGGDGTTPADPVTSFSLLPSNYFTSYNKTINLTGTDNLGESYTVEWLEQTGVETTFLGVPAIPILTQIQYANTTTGATVTSDVTQYYSTSASDRHYLGDSGVTETVSATTTAIPQTAVIGAFGNIGTYIDNVGDIEEHSWMLDDGGNGMAKMVILFISKDPSGNVTRSETQAFLIDENGNRLSTTVESENASGESVTLTGS